MPQGFDTDFGKLGDVSEFMKDFNEGYMKSIKRYGLYPEVLVWSLAAMKKNPDLEIMDAIYSALVEWDLTI